MSDWDEAAKRFIQSEKKQISAQRPKGYPVFIEWKGDAYTGSLQHVAPEFSNEIVLLSKTSKPIPPQLKDAILRVQPDRTQLSANKELDLEGIVHIVRKVDYSIEIMSSEQLEYMMQKNISIEDSKTGKVFSGSQTHFYQDKKSFDPSNN